MTADSSSASEDSPPTPASSLDTEELLDIAIVGAGPCGLAIAARLSETTPAALFTEAEHQRHYSWINRQTVRPLSNTNPNGQRRHQSRNNRGTSEDTNSQIPAGGRSYKIVVLDNTGGDWMAGWKSRFAGLAIKHLRSPMFFHIDPADRNGLLAFVHSYNGDCTCDRVLEIRGVVGKEGSKHQRKKRKEKEGKKGTNSSLSQCPYDQSRASVDERDRQDYFTPSTELFNRFCSSIVTRYDLGPCLSHCDVSEISYHPTGFPGSWPDPHFRLVTRGLDAAGSQQTKILSARAVIMAIGPGGRPSHQKEDGSCHSAHLGSSGNREMKLPDFVEERISNGKETNVMVVGGGLTSAQITDLLVKKGVSKVWHVMRGPFKVKHFDFDLEWVAKYKNLQQSAFWMADSDEERLEMILQARNGGSITPRYQRILQSHVRGGRVSIHTGTSISTRVWNKDNKIWSITTSPPLHCPPVGGFDYIYHATGIPADFANLPLVQPLMESHPLQCLGGLPVLTRDLMWREDVPCFVTGRLAGLRLGPAAANLEGARMGAERIAWKIEEMFGAEGTNGTRKTKQIKDERGKHDMFWGRNLYEALDDLMVN